MRKEWGNEMNFLNLARVLSRYLLYPKIYYIQYEASKEYLNSLRMIIRLFVGVQWFEIFFLFFICGGMIETVSILLLIFEPVYRIVGSVAWHKKLGLGIGDGRMAEAPFLPVIKRDQRFR